MNLASKKLSDDLKTGKYNLLDATLRVTELVSLSKQLSELLSSLFIAEFAAGTIVAYRVHASSGPAFSLPTMDITSRWATFLLIQKYMDLRTLCS